MAKKDKIQENAAKSKVISSKENTEKPLSSTKPAEVANEIEKSDWLSQLTKGFIPYVIISILGLAIYANTFHHEYALDDDIIICKNEYVLEGVKGFPKIFTTDVFESFYRSMNTKAQLSGGRYRPFSLATYALEQEVIGTKVFKADYDDPNVKISDSVTTYFSKAWDLNKNGVGDKNEDLDENGLYNDRDVKVKGMPLRHVVNTLLYILSVCIIYYFFVNYFFKDYKLLALLAALLFLTHPIHTEVVSNVKSRDEILSLMFMTLTMIFSLKYVEQKHNKFIILAALSYFIALLSKEYGATLLALIPLLFIVQYKNQFELKRYLPVLGGLLVAFLIYYKIRSGIVLDLDDSEIQNEELMNNPYLLCEGTEKLATIIYTNLKYFILLILPLKLSCDYSYGTIPYVELSNPVVWLTLLIFGALAYWGIKALIKKSWIAFAIAFIVVHLLLVNNFLFNIGATMGERLVYHSSLGVSMLMVYGAYLLAKKMKQPALLLAITLPFIAFYSIKTVLRNPAWKNDIALHLTDVKTYPNSTMLLANACTRKIELAEQPKNKDKEKEILKEAEMYGLASLRNHPKFVNSLLNVGIIKAKFGEMDSAKYYWDKVREYYPHHPQLSAIDANLALAFYNKAGEYIKKQDYFNAQLQYAKALPYMANNPNIYHDIAVTYFYMGQYGKAKEYWMQSLALNPNNQQAQNGINQLRGMGY